MSGYGSVRKNRSITSKALKLDGKIFNNGLGTHANSDIRYNIPPAAKRFSSVCHIYSSRKEKSDMITTQNRTQVGKPYYVYSSDNKSPH